MLTDSEFDMAQRFEISEPATRFPFGKNWQRYLRLLDEERIAEAENSLCSMLEIENLAGKSFLDVGCGSGLFSLAAMRKGATRVHSFDYDPHSGACARELKHRYFPDANFWTIQQGDVLDSAYLSSLGQFDYVYSWGVLHHTGNLWGALENVVPLVTCKGKLFIAVYNDQGSLSRVWHGVKELYNRGTPWRMLLIPAFGSYFIGKALVKDLLISHKNPLARYRQRKQSRGMAYWTDLRDWLGGYPFEVARPEAVLDFFRLRRFELVKLTTAGGGHWNNEFVFSKSAE
jgi:2-polyprenyl-3-methyl-5-hydroxy-6-metoxy-1,4-benzoquinol methylase